jgi:hypothetical protein
MNDLLEVKGSEALSKAISPRFQVSPVASGRHYLCGSGEARSKNV